MGIDFHRCSGPLVARLFMLKRWPSAFERIEAIAGTPWNTMCVLVPANHTLALRAHLDMIRTTGNTHNNCFFNG